MSSEIYYEKAFISIGDRFIPLVCRGSTNTFEFNVHGCEVAERYWSVLDLPYRGRLLFTSDEIQKIAETYEGFNSGNRGGMRKSRNSAFEAGEFQRWFLAGLKNAHTIEEFYRPHRPAYTEDNVCPHDRSILGRALPHR